LFDSKFVSRLGNKLFAPDWFKSGLPTNETLDGELFGGRGKFQETVGLVKSHEADWTGLSFQVFDIPSKGDQPFETRMELLKKILENAPKHISIVEQEKCTSREHLRNRLAQVENHQGEGLMLRMPNTPYISKRSFTLLKVRKRSQL